MPDEALRDKLWMKFADHVDHWLGPMALATLTVLCSAQLVTRIPAVRTYVDAVEGRFYSVPATVIPASALHESTVVQVYLSPNIPRPDVQVLVNGQAIGSFTSTSLNLRVTEGDTIGFRSHNGGDLLITFDDDDPNLFVPAPGQTVELTAQDPIATMGPVAFTH